MRNREKTVMDEFLDGIDIRKEKLVGNTYSHLETGFCRLIKVHTRFRDDTKKELVDDVKILHPQLPEDTDRCISPAQVMLEVAAIWGDKPQKGQRHVTGWRYVNGGVQLAFTIGGAYITEKFEVETPVKRGKQTVIEKGVETRRTGYEPFYTFQVGNKTFRGWMIWLHRYDRAKKEIHMEIEFEGLSMYFKKPDDENFKLTTWIQDVFAKLQALDPDETNKVKEAVTRHIIGVTRRSDITPKQTATLEKFDALARAIQKNGVNLFGETGLGVLWGVAHYAELAWMDNTLENDMVGDFKNKSMGRNKMDAVMDVILDFVNEKLP